MTQAQDFCTRQTQIVPWQTTTFCFSDNGPERESGRDRASDITSGRYCVRVDGLFSTIWKHVEYCPVCPWQVAGEKGFSSGPIQLQLAACQSVFWSLLFWIFLMSSACISAIVNSRHEGNVPWQVRFWASSLELLNLCRFQVVSYCQTKLLCSLQLSKMLTISRRR